MEIIRFVDVFGKSQADIQPDVLQLDFWFGRHFLELTENPPQQLEEGIKKMFFLPAGIHVFDQVQQPA